MNLGLSNLIPCFTPAIWSNVVALSILELTQEEDEQQSQQTCSNFHPHLEIRSLTVLLILSPPPQTVVLSSSRTRTSSSSCEKWFIFFSSHPTSSSPSFFLFFFWHIATEAGYPRRPSKVGGFVQLSVRAFRPSAHTASHISVWRGGQKGERGSAATSREREKTLLSADCCGALGVPPPSFLRDPSPPSPSIRVFRNWQLIGN